MGDPPEVTIQEPVILIRIAHLWDLAITNDELYDATRGHWKVGPPPREGGPGVRGGRGNRARGVRDPVLASCRRDAIENGHPRRCPIWEMGVRWRSCESRPPFEVHRPIGEGLLQARESERHPLRQLLIL